MNSVNCSRLHGCVTIPTDALHVLSQGAVPAARCQMSPGSSPLQVQACRGYAERMEEERVRQNPCPAVLGMLTSVVSLQCVSVSPLARLHFNSVDARIRCALKQLSRQQVVAARVILIKNEPQTRLEATSIIILKKIHLPTFIF